MKEIENKIMSEMLTRISEAETSTRDQLIKEYCQFVQAVTARRSLDLIQSLQ